MKEEKSFTTCFLKNSNFYIVDMLCYYSPHFSSNQTMKTKSFTLVLLFFIINSLSSNRSLIKMKEALCYVANFCCFPTHPNYYYYYYFSSIPWLTTPKKRRTKDWNRKINALLASHGSLLLNLSDIIWCGYIILSVLVSQVIFIFTLHCWFNS